MSQVSKTNKIKSIYNNLYQINLVKNFNLTQLYTNLHYLNHLIFKSYLIFRLNISKQKKIILLTRLRDPDGNTLFNKKTAKYIIDNYSDKILETYHNIIKKRKRTFIKQEGGHVNDYKNNKINNIIKIIKSDTKIQNNFNNINKILNLKENVDNLKIIFMQENNQLTSDNLIDWIFFPLYKLETLPLVGFIFEIPLDIIGIVIDASDIFIGMITPFIIKSLDLLGTVGSSIPYVGTILAPFNTVMALGSDVIEHALVSSLDVLGLLINLQRKQFGLAYVSALEVFPILPELMDSFLTISVTLNKHLKKSEPLLSLVKINSNIVSDLVKIYQEDKNILKDSDKIWNSILYPRSKHLPIYKKIPKKKIKNLYLLIYDIFKILSNEINKTEKFINENISIEKLFDKKKKLNLIL